MDAELYFGILVNQWSSIRQGRKKWNRYLLLDLSLNSFSAWWPVAFENKATYEAKIANAFDKLEVQLEHNDAGHFNLGRVRIPYVF